MRMFVILGCCIGVACRHGAAPAPASRVDFGTLQRGEFNQRCAERLVPAFWREDTNANGLLDPQELVALVPVAGGAPPVWVGADGQFSDAFVETYRALVKSEPQPDGPEGARRAAVLKELRQGRATLIETSLLDAGTEDQRLAAHMLTLGGLVDALYQKQTGSWSLRAGLAGLDAPSQALFHRNQGPTCVAPETEKDAVCTAVPGAQRPRSGLYPASIQSNKDFCGALAAMPNARALMDHFSAVREGADGGFLAVPYPQAFPEDMAAIAAELERTAADVTSAEEAALRAYLLAAARAFRTNDWVAADEAWVAMGRGKSRWYLRIGPDEVYFEPCAWKAGFALSFARTNAESKVWQDKLEPLKADMEREVAGLAGAPYRARTVGFALPDFIDVVLNAGDNRNPHGATIGQSLPNWGKVAESGGRTVAMVNLYTDADSRKTLEAQMGALFCPDALARTSSEPRHGTLSVVLHEAMHNLGPAHDYKVKGKADEELFGGPLAATLEELKAQTGAMLFTAWLSKKGIISEDDAVATHLRDLAWGFGHVSRGLYTADGKPRNYSHLASIQLGFFLEQGALVFRPRALAANGTDQGCYGVDVAKLQESVRALARLVFGIKSRGDREQALALVARHVDSKNSDWATQRAVITERWLRAPKATFVYAVQTGVRP